jgi:transposase
MAWTAEQRRIARERKEARSELGYNSDLTDAEWARVEPHIPPQRCKNGNRRTDMRRVVEAILYINWTGCQWAALPKDYPPYTTVNGYFLDWTFNGIFDNILHALVVDERDTEGRDGSPTLMIIDAQSVKSGPNRGGKELMESGFDGGKKILGAKRHAVVDVNGNLLGVVVTSANADDRTIAVAVLAYLRPFFPFVKLILGDAGYTGPAIAAAVAEVGEWRFEVEKRSDAANGFKPNRRWPVERLFALIGLCRRLSKNFERFAETAESWFKLAYIRILLRRTPAYA